MSKALDLDHLGAEFGHQPCGKRGGDERSDLDDADSAKSSHGAASCFLEFVPRLEAVPWAIPTLCWKGAFAFRERVVGLFAELKVIEQQPAHRGQGVALAYHQQQGSMGPVIGERNDSQPKAPSE